MKKIVFLLVFLMPYTCAASITKDVSASSIGVAASATISFTNTTGDELLVFVKNDGSTVSSATYNGIALSKVFSNSSWIGSEIWALKKPDIGTHNLVVNFGASNTYGIYVISFSGTGNPAIGVTNSCVYPCGTTQTPTVSASTTADNSMLVGGWEMNINGTILATGAGHTRDETNAQAADGTGHVLSHKTTTAAGTYSIDYDLGSAVTSQGIVVEILAATSSGGGGGSSTSTTIALADFWAKFSFFLIGAFSIGFIMTVWIWRLLVTR